MPLKVFAAKYRWNPKEEEWILKNDKDTHYYNNSALKNAWSSLSYPIYDGDYYFAFIHDKPRVNAKYNAEANRELRRYIKSFLNAEEIYDKMHDYFQMKFKDAGAGDTMTREELWTAVVDMRKKNPAPKKPVKESRYNMFGYGAGDKQDASDDSYVINQRAKETAKRQGKVWNRMSYGDQQRLRDQEYKKAGFEKRGSRWIKPKTDQEKEGEARRDAAVAKYLKQKEREKNASPKEKIEIELEKLEKQRDHFDEVASDARERSEEAYDEGNDSKAEELDAKATHFEDKSMELDSKIEELQDKISNMKESKESVIESAMKVMKMYRDPSWKKLIKKHKRHIDAFRNEKKQKDLPKNVEDDLVSWALDNGEISQKDEVEDFIDDILNENYRKLAQYGMGTETSKSARVGLELDFYDSKGNKKFGKILQKTNTGYLVKDDKGKKHVLKYLDRKKAKDMLKPNYIHTESINEVQDKEITMARKLSKDMEKVKKGYQQIAKAGDKTLKDTKFNSTYEAILKAQQKVLSLIGELSNQKMMQKEDSKVRPVMSSNIMDSYRIMHEESMQDKLSKLFKMRDKKAIDGVANLLNMTSVKVLQSMQKQNPKGFERMAKKMGELPAMEGKEIIDEKLSREDLKLIDKMYDKKGNLTPIGKKVMEYGKKKKK